MSKPVLYVFGGSVWASAPQLAADELGYSEEHIEKRSVNLVRGENFNPSFLDINPKGTLPTLTTPENVHASTADVVRYLVENAPKPAGKPSGTDLIEKLHDESIDPNFSLLSTRSEAELKAKGANLPGAFVRGRQETLERLVPTAPQHKAFYDAKLAGNGFLVSLFDNTAPPEAVQGFLAKSEAHWKNVSQFIVSDLPNYLPQAGFIGGGKPGEDDFHLAAWLARIAAVAGGDPGPEGVLALEKELGGKGTVPDKVVKYWQLWAERESWKTQYSKGLH